LNDLVKPRSIKEKILTRLEDAARPIYLKLKGFQNLISTNIIFAYRRKKFLRLVEERMSNYRGIFIQSGFIEWNIPLFQRPQHFARAMSRAGFLVIYLTPNVWRDNVHGFEEIEPNLFLSNDLRLIYKISGALVSFYSTCSGYTADDIDRVRAKGNKVLYEYVDHIDPKISWSHVKLLKKVFDHVSEDTVDYVLATSRRLVDEMQAKVGQAKVLYIPNGVDYEHYHSIVKRKSASTPEPLLKLVDSGKPIVGYFGAIAPWLWYDLIGQCAVLLPEINFVFIGPDYLKAARKLPQRNNFCYLGPIEYIDLPHYARHFTIGIIPFSPGDIAKSTSPLKLYEYFALRKPVVVTSDMEECVAYPEVFQGHDAESFCEKINLAITLSTDQDYLTRVETLALENTWQKRADAAAVAMAL